jgi:hypothetical protein
MKQVVEHLVENTMLFKRKELNNSMQEEAITDSTGGGCQTQAPHAHTKSTQPDLMQNHEFSSTRKVLTNGVR